jgi:hypothetical protein
MALPEPEPGLVILLRVLQFRQALPAAGIPHPTPSFFCRLVDDVVYWKTNRLSGKM